MSSDEEGYISPASQHQSDKEFSSKEEVIEIYRKFYPTKKCQDFPFPEKIEIKEFNNSMSDIVCEKISDLKYRMEKKNYVKINKFLLTYPEFKVQKINIDYELLDELPPEYERSREKVLEWMEKHMNLEDILYVGW